MTADSNSGGLTRSVAFYLPQFHSIEENDRWWGEGFTDWRNVRRAVPKFEGHWQPHVPTELGYYDLTDPSVRARQADLAAKHSVDAFCYYHYWFGGRRLLERPFEGVLRSGEPDFPFLLCWANENWTRAWSGGSRSVLVAQDYSEADDLAHIRHLASAFADPRYMRLDGKPVFLVYRATDLPDARRTTDLWRAEASRLGIGELLLVRVESFPNERGEPATLGFDASVAFAPDWREVRGSLTERIAQATQRRLRPHAAGYRRLQYTDVVDSGVNAAPVTHRRFPCVAPSWDNTPRRSSGAVVVEGATPDAYGDWVRRTVADQRPDLLFVNAWNEWGEGAHLEPCSRWGRSYLEAHRDAMATQTQTEVSQP